MYQVGFLEDSKENDPVFDDLLRCRKYAKEQSEEYPDIAIGIWRVEDPYSPLVEIFVRGERFVKE